MPASPEVAAPVDDHLAELVAREQPAELQVYSRLRLRQRLDAQDRPENAGAGHSGAAGEQVATMDR